MLPIGKFGNWPLALIVLRVNWLLDWRWGGLEMDNNFERELGR